MSGINNNTAAPSGPPGLKNPLLQQVEEKLESGLTPENHQNYLKIVVAGLHIALDKGADGFMARLAQSKDPIADCARGAVALVLIMRKDAKGVMPLKAMIPAGMTLMLRGLDFIDRAKIGKIAEPELDRATTIFTNFLFAKLRITPAMLQHAAGKVHSLMQDPAAMQKINMKAGLLRHPMSATPTPVPEGRAVRTTPEGPPGLIDGGGRGAGTPSGAKAGG